MRRSFLPDQAHRTGFITENAERKNLGRTDGRRIDKVAMGEVLSNLDQVFFDSPAAAGTPPGLSSGSQPYWGGVKNNFQISCKDLVNSARFLVQCIRRKQFRLDL